MSIAWINCSLGVLPAIAAALTVTLASFATETIGRARRVAGRAPRRIAWRRKITIELQVKVSGSRRAGW